MRKSAQLVIQMSKDGEDLPTDSSCLTNVKIGVDGAKKEEITQLLEKHKSFFPKQFQSDRSVMKSLSNKEVRHPVDRHFACPNLSLMN